MIKEYKLRLNNKEYNIEIEEQIIQKEELTFEKFEDEWKNIRDVVFLKKRETYLVGIICLFLIPFIISCVILKIKFYGVFNELNFLFFLKTYLISTLVSEFLLIILYWKIYIPNNLKKIINNRNNMKLKRKLEKIFNEKNIKINDKIFDFYKLLIKEKFIISKKENYNKILNKLEGSIIKINKKSSTIVGYISNNFIKSFCLAMIMANVNAFYCAYYSNTKNLSVENFINNIVFFGLMIGLGMSLNYFIMDYYKPTLKEIDKKKKCIKKIWKES